MKTKFWVGGGIILAITLLIILQVVGGQEVEVLTVQPGQLATWVEDTAYVQVQDDVVIQASSSGKVIKVAVESGQKVQAGQELLVMENPDMQYQLDQLGVQIEQLQGEMAAAEIELDESRTDLLKGQKDLQRDQQLFQAGAMSAAEYETRMQTTEKLQKTVDRQELAIHSLSKQLEKQNTTYHDLQYRNQQLTVRSPVAGTVLDLPVKKEQAIIPGNTLAQVGNTGELELKTELLSDDLAEIKVGQTVEISAPILGDKILNGQVKKIYPRAYEKTSALGVIQRRVPVLISLPAHEHLQPGYEVQVKIQTHLKSKILVLPRQSLRIDEQGNPEVMAVVQGRVQHLKVQTGLKNPTSVEIRSGLQAGQVVIRDASSDIKDKTRIKIPKS